MKLSYPIFQFCAHLAGLVPQQFRLGSPFHETVTLMKKAEEWPPERIRQWQFERLQRIVQYAGEHVPFYRTSFKALGLHWKDLRSLDDIKLLPLLKKNMVLEQPDAFIADRENRKKLILAVTGGSTGAPMPFYLQKDHNAIEAAFVSHLLKRFGCKIGDPYVVMRTQRESRHRGTPYWTYNPHRNQLVISSYLISEQSVPEMAKRIRAFKPAYILAIPSTAALFSHWLAVHGESIGTPPRVIVLGSENSYPEQRRLISDALQAPTIMHYGQSESVVTAEEDNPYGFYHVNPFYGLAEVLDPDENSMLTPGKTGEIVGTGFHNFAMPLIRYCTSDVARIAEGCSRWGVEGNLWQSIEGRTVELIETKDGRWIMLAALLFGTHDSTLSNVLQLQVEQSEKGVLLLRIVKRPNYAAKDEGNIREMIRKLSHNGFDISFDYVANIERGVRGKHRLLLQHLTMP